MEVNYSSIPETRNPIKILLTVTISAILFGVALLWCNRVNNKKNENRDLR